MDNKLIINCLQSGGVGIMPTDTVYGVVGQLMSEAAVERIYELKRRDPNKRVGTILFANLGQIKEFISRDLLEKAMKYWPGPVSVELPLPEKLHYAHKGLNSLAFRIPADEILRKLLERTGPLATSSANLEGQPPATTIAQAKKYFGAKADFYVDGGDLSGRKPSKIIEFSADGSELELRS